MGASAAAVALMLFCFGAVAQEKKTAPPAKAPEPKAAAPAAAAKPVKPPSPCKGLEEAVCKTKPECAWRAAITTKAGKPRKAHCRLKSGGSKAKAK